MAPYAGVLPTSARPLTLTLRKGAVAVATVELSISSRWLKDYKLTLTLTLNPDPGPKPNPNLNPNPNQARGSCCSRP